MLTTEITSLDRKVTSIQGGMITARHAIMEIVSKSRPYMQQFLGVDRHLTGSGVVISFLPQVESEARCVMAGLLPFLRHKHGDDIAKCFNPLAINIHKESTWDPETQEVVTAADHQVATLAEINPEMDCKIERRHWIIDSPPKTKHKTKTGKSDQSQQGIQGGVMSHASDAWGDKISWKTSDVCRIGFLNPTGFPV